MTMKSHASVSKATRKSSGDSSRPSSGGESAVAKEPPPSGVEFVDKGMAATVAVQRVGEPEPAPDYAKVTEIVNNKIATEPVPEFLRRLGSLSEEFVKNNWKKLIRWEYPVSKVAGVREKNYARDIFMDLKEPVYAQSVGVNVGKEGGREWGVDPATASEMIQGLAEHVTNNVNQVTGIEPAPVRIAGSAGVMKVDPNRFIADDIDLDYYRVPFDKDEWNSAKQAFEKVPKYISEFGTADHGRSRGEGESIVHSQWSFAPSQEPPREMMTIDVELKDVTGPKWHEGFQEGKSREVGESPWIPTSQLYIDVCSRLVDLVLQAESKGQGVKQVYEAAKEKHLLTKREVLLKALGDKVSRAEQMARDKLAQDRFDRWKEVSDGKLRVNVAGKDEVVCLITKPQAQSPLTRT